MAARNSIMNEPPRSDSALPDGRGPLKLFISYSSKDDAQRETLDIHLTPLVRAGLIEVWHDRKIQPGEKWSAAIAAKLNSANVILLLVSANFLESDYCYEIEMTRALARDDAGEARVVPIILNDCLWPREPFARLQVLPTRAKPVLKYGNRAEAWTIVAEEIAKLADGAPGASRGGGLPPVSPERYLAALKEEHAYLDIRGMGAQVTERMELAQVYTRLSVSAPRDADPKLRGTARQSKAASDAVDEDSLRGDTHRELRDVMADNPHAALVGDPGSGKTTFLRYVAQNLARVHLGEPEALDRIGLTGQPPFPIFAGLAKVARFLTDNPDLSYADDAPEHFYRYLDSLLAGQPSYGLPPDYLRHRVLAGGCLLLLDGLDEVPGDAMRERMVRLIGQMITSRKAVNCHLITCRTRAYEGHVQLAGDVATLRLAPLERPQVQEFAEAWSRALYRVNAGEVNSASAAQAATYRDDLLRAIDENPSGATFSRSPLMLTVLSVVHWDKKRLPEQRAELYDAAVTYLLESRREHSTHPAPLRRECLQAVAIAMFEDPEGVQRTLGRTNAAGAVRALLGVTQQEALDFLENEELYSGVLVSRTAGEVEFWHLTFQEYLAGLELSQAEDGWSRAACHLYEDRWVEVILLLAGCERRQGGVRAARRMIERILNTGTDTVSKARAIGLVGRILRDIRAYGGEPEQGTTYADDLRKTLAIFEPGGEEVPEPVRVEVGEALGQVRDPRFDNPEANRVLIPAGSFWMGAQKADPNGLGYDAEADDDEAPVRSIAVPAFRIGRYPLTVAEFREFLEAGDAGYLNPKNWDPRGWEWRSANGRTTPGAWDQQPAHPNRPVTRVSWYEADAYCRWKGGRLPTEAEWEWVARGTTGRKYPWGRDDPTARHANFKMHVGSPTPVGIYPGDAHEHGVRDLAGNVWEWCNAWYVPYVSEITQGATAPKTGPSRVLRGGSFSSYARDLRAAFRLNIHPEYEYFNFGFRVVWSLAGGQT
jgi:formylglycine-generating enzyme required for sulfatase activity